MIKFLVLGISILGSAYFWLLYARFPEDASTAPPPPPSSAQLRRNQIVLLSRTGKPLIRRAVRRLPTISENYSVTSPE
jgi:hypothetical protein